MRGVHSSEEEMLQERVICYRRLGSRTLTTGEVVEAVTPDWLSSRDHVWLRAMCEELEDLAGETAALADERVFSHVLPIARLHGAGRVRVMGVWAVERRRWTSRVASPVAPEKIRAAVFAAKVGRTRAEALAYAASELGIPEAAIEESLFADRSDARLLVAPPEAASPRTLEERYNMALTQAFLMRSTRVSALVREHVRSVVRYAKLKGLMCTFEECDAGTLLTFSGPLALFHETTKYGRALSGMLPNLSSTPGWAMRAEVRLRGLTHLLELDAATTPLPLVHALPKTHDSLVERRLMTDVRRSRTGWALVREDTVVRVNQRLFFPDFTLVAPDGVRRVRVEIVGYWEPKYLAEKVEALAAVQEPIVICVDRRHARGALAPRANVLPFDKGRIDVATLFATATTLLSFA
jgi:predicted nuclease of restriction endonuclease-like RecB superfamily